MHKPNIKQVFLATADFVCSGGALLCEMATAPIVAPFRDIHSEMSRPGGAGIVKPLIEVAQFGFMTSLLTVASWGFGMMAGPLISPASFGQTPPEVYAVHPLCAPWGTLVLPALTVIGAGNYMLTCMSSDSKTYPITSYIHEKFRHLYDSSGGPRRCKNVTPTSGGPKLTL